MRKVTGGRAHRGSWTLILLTVALVALVLAAPAFAAGAPSASPGTPVADPPPAQALTATLSVPSVVFGDEVSVSGALTPATAGVEVAVTVGGAPVGTVETGADGAYALAFTPRRSGQVVASLTADPAVASDPVQLGVKPQASVTHGALVPYLPSAVVVRIAPSAYDGLVVVKVTHKGALAGSYKARAKDGKATFRIPFGGVDGFALSVTLPPGSGLDARSLQAKVSVRAKTLAAGSTGPYVKGMLTALQRLKFRVPNLGSSFTSQVKDSVMAFQKAYRLPRTYVFNTACWRRIDGAALIKARHARPATHLEVDKGRQIAMVVRNGKPAGIICVSTGATGNTPEGTFHIQQKHSYTTSGYGGVLVRTMGFVGNFAMHGYSPVPPYPASHGCVREPIWACYWMYDNSFVGETLYIYH